MKRAPKSTPRRRANASRVSSRGVAQVPIKSFQIFGANLRRLRLERELSQERLAEQANVHWTQVARIEHGKMNPSLRTIIRLAKGLGCELEELVAGLT